MTIKHHPITDTEKVCKLYSEKDGVLVKHVCTTEFNNGIVDVFYRETPHPEFGNKYFVDNCKLSKPIKERYGDTSYYKFGYYSMEIESHEVV